MPTIVDLNAEADKLATSLGIDPQTMPGEPKGGIARLGLYRDGVLLLGMSARTGAGHWETHREDELIHILEGTTTLDIVCDDGPTRSFELRAGTVAVVPQGAWHRFRSAGLRKVMSATIPGEHIDLDVDDPRTDRPGLDTGKTLRPPSIVDLEAELAKLTMLRGRTPQTTFADRKGSAAILAPYRDGFLLVGKSAGKSHWETHPADELVHVLDGTVILDIVEDDRLQSCTLGAGMMVVVPRGAWHRVHSAEGATTFSATLPGEHIDLDIDDPRTTVVPTEARSA
jgi:mannose-6-phosphate isomerase-like protein (cupin superfamily)